MSLRGRKANREGRRFDRIFPIFLIECPLAFIARLQLKKRSPCFLTPTFFSVRSSTLSRRPANKALQDDVLIARLSTVDVTQTPHPTTETIGLKDFWATGGLTTSCSNGFFLAMRRLRALISTKRFYTLLVRCLRERR